MVNFPVVHQVVFKPLLLRYSMLYFLVYDDMTHTAFLEDLLTSVRLHAPEFNILIKGRHDLDASFFMKHSHILNHRRGGGYWLWKPYIIYTTLLTLQEGDILFYMDSKYYFTQPFAGLYEDYLKTHDIMLWKNKPNDRIYSMKHWCKMDVLQKYSMDKMTLLEDCWAGALLLRTTKETVEYMNKWLHMCCSYHDITDSPSILPNVPEFIEHRHDQSLLSILAHTYHIPLCYFEKKYLQSIREPF